MERTEQKEIPSWRWVQQVENVNQLLSFDQNWKFFLGEQVGASERLYDDSSWETINLPHDFSLLQDYSQQGEAESGYKLGGTGWYRKYFMVHPEVAIGRIELHFDGSYMETEVFINGTKLGFHPNGYSEFSFDLTEHILSNQVNTLAVKVVNPVPSSRWYSGSGLYRSVTLLTTPKVHLIPYGVIVETPTLQQDVEGQSPISVEVTSRLVNDSENTENVWIKTSLFERDKNGGVGRQIAEDSTLAYLVDRGKRHQFTQSFSLSELALWSVDTPHLYIVRTEVYCGRSCIQSQDVETGFRWASFDKDKGFQLNGQRLKLQGVCLHHDQGGLGAKAYYHAIKRQLEIMKDMGANAVRVTHNPAARHLKDLANRLGLLVIDEAFDTWEYAKNGNTNDYARYFHQIIGENATHLLGVDSAEQTWAEFHIKQMVKSGRNDPSILLWSIGNEVLEGFTAPTAHYPEVAAQLIEWVQQVDRSRPVTFGDNKLKERWQQALGMAECLHQNGGIIGFNYANGEQYDNARRCNPNWILYGSETASSVNSRGVYSVKGHKPTWDKQLTSYDQSKVPWGHLASEAWYDTITRDFVAGEFVWTGFDYLGEPTPWNGIGSGPVAGWPSPKSSYFGIVDTAGFPKDSYYFYRSQWRQTDTTLHVLPVWEKENVTVDDDGNVEVVVYSNAASVELFFQDLDGKEHSLGRKEFCLKQTQVGFSYQLYEGEDCQQENHKNLYLTWNVPYQPGSIQAIAYDAEGVPVTQTVGRSHIGQSGLADHLELFPYAIPPDITPQTLVYVAIQVHDESGALVSSATNEISIEIEGPARLLAMDNGNPMDYQSYGENNREAFHGQILAVLALSGEPGCVSLSAHSQGLHSASLQFNVVIPQSSEGRVIAGIELPHTVYLPTIDQDAIPSSVGVRYTDGSELQKGLQIESLPANQEWQTRGYVRLSGSIEGQSWSVPLTIVPLEQVAVMKNSSMAVEVGVFPHLPATVQGFNRLGELLPVQFPVEWEVIEKEQFSQEGYVVVEGQVRLSNYVWPVTMRIRVGRKSRIVGQDVVASASKVSYIVEKEGLAVIYQYDTAQQIGQIGVLFNQENAKNQVHFGWSSSGEGEFEEVAAHLVGTECIDSRQVTYCLETPVPAVRFKVTFPELSLSNQQLHDETTVPSIALFTMVELFTYNSDAHLRGIRVGTKEYPIHDESSQINVPGSGEVACVPTSSNASMTLIQLSSSKYQIVVESEDKSHLKQYTLYLSTEVSD